MVMFVCEAMKTVGKSAVITHQIAKRFCFGRIDLVDRITEKNL